MEVIVLVAAGFAGGLIGGMGMGGGTLLIPFLTLLCGYAQHTAQGTNLLAFVPMAAISLVIHAKNGLLRMKYLPSVALPAVAASVFTSFAAMNVEGELLGKIFGWFLVAVGTYMLGEAVFGKKEPPALSPLFSENGAGSLGKRWRRGSR